MEWRVYPRQLSSQQNAGAYSEGKNNMRKLSLASAALFLALAVVPAMAGDKSNNSPKPASFQALSQLSAPGQIALAKMTDKELATVEGQRVVVIKSNRARVSQRNLAACLALCGAQANYSGIIQIND